MFVISGFGRFACQRIRRATSVAESPATPWSAQSAVSGQFGGRAVRSFQKRGAGEHRMVVNGAMRFIDYIPPVVKHGN